MARQRTTILIKAVLVYDDDVVPNEGVAQDRWLQSVSGVGLNVQTEHMEIVAGLCNADGVPVQERVPSRQGRRVR